MGLSWRGMQSLVWRCCGLPQCSTMLPRAAWLLMTPTVQLQLERQASDSLIAATHMLRYATRIMSPTAGRLQQLAVCAEGSSAHMGLLAVGHEPEETCRARAQQPG